MNRKIINSENYWDNRFNKDWEINEGSQQTIFFCNIFLSNIPQFLKKEFKKGGTFIDVGCVLGECCYLIKKNFEKLDVYGCDISKIAIEKAKFKFKNIKFLKKGIDNLNEKFDFVFCSNVLEHFRDYKDKLLRLIKSTKKHLIILVPFDEKRLIKEHFTNFNLSSFDYLIDNFCISFFKVINLRNLENTLWYGSQILVVYSNIHNLKNVTLENFDYIDEIDKLKSNEKDIKKRYKQLELELNKIKNGKIWLVINSYYELKKNLKINLFKIRKRLSFYWEFTRYFLMIKNLIKKIDQRKLKIIYLPSIEYHYPLFQRPQYLAENLVKNKDVFFIYLQASFLYSKKKAFEKIAENFYLSKLWRTVPYLIKPSWIMLVSGQAITTVYDLLRYKKIGQKIIYDYVDEITPEITGDEKSFEFLKERHEAIKQKRLADLVLVTAKKLYNEMLAYYPKNKVILVPNAVDTDIFNPKNQFKKYPTKLKEILNLKKPIIGYHGAIAPWLDFDLINNLAKKRPDLIFLFIGADYRDALKNLDLSLKNIFYLGTVNYKEIPCYANLYDVAIIPFKKGEIAKKTSPLKLFEYLALGKLVVATEDLIECYNKPGVYIAFNEVSNFSEKIDLALKNKNNDRILKEIKKFVDKNTWSERVKKILKKIS
jgi:SAM-dependent methyltransferase